MDQQQGEALREVRFCEDVKTPLTECLPLVLTQVPRNTGQNCLQCLSRPGIDGYEVGQRPLPCVRVPVWTATWKNTAVRAYNDVVSMPFVTLLHLL